MKKRIALFCCGLYLLALLIPSAQTQAGLLRIYFIDVDQGESTLIVSPTGKTLLIDGGEPGDGEAFIVPLFQELGLARLDYLVATHYHSDHYGGLAEVAKVFPPAVAYDSGDLTAPFGNPVFSQYLTAVSSVRQTIKPGTVIDLGGGARATCLVVNGALISGGRVGIFGRHDMFDQLPNSACIGLLVQYGDFDYWVAGDLVGGGINTTDVESTVSQLVGDVDVLQIHHHGSRTSSNPTFLNALKAEVGIIQLSGADGVGLPTIEVIDRFINTTPTSGMVPRPPDDDFPPPRPPLVYQNEFSPPFSQSSNQGIVARGTILIQTDGSSYTISGGRLRPTTFPTDGAGRGVQTDFPPSIILTPSQVVPEAGQSVRVTAQILDDSGKIEAASLSYSVNGGEPVPVEFNRVSNINFAGEIPGQPDGTLVQYHVVAEDDAGQTSAAEAAFFAGTTPIEAVRVNERWGVPRFQNVPVRVAGAVTVGTGTFSRSNTDVFVQDATAGIEVFESRLQSQPVAVGDRVSVTGRLRGFNGLLELDVTNPLPNVPFGSPFGIGQPQGQTDVAPVVKTLADIDESVEGMLVRVDGARIVEGSIPATDSANLVIVDGTGELTLRVLSTTDIPGMATPAGQFSIVGVVGQFDRFRPFDSGYQILPRRRADFIGNQ